MKNNEYAFKGSTMPLLYFYCIITVLIIVYVPSYIMVFKWLSPYMETIETIKIMKGIGFLQVLNVALFIVLFAVIGKLTFGFLFPAQSIKVALNDHKLTFYMKKNEITILKDQFKKSVFFIVKKGTKRNVRWLVIQRRNGRDYIIEEPDNNKDFDDFIQNYKFYHKMNLGKLKVKRLDRYNSFYKETFFHK